MEIKRIQDFLSLAKTLGFRTPAEVFFEHCFKQGAGIQPVVALGS